MAGEAVGALEVERRGVIGDRYWAARSAEGKLGSGKNSRRFQRMPGLLDVAVRTGAGGVPVLTLPGGDVEVGDPRAAAGLSSFLGMPVELTTEEEVSHLDAAPVHVLTTSSLRWIQSQLPGAVIDARRFRPNIVIDNDGDGPAEDAWLGQRLAAGDAVLRVVARTVRCVMTTLAQGDLAFAPRVLDQLERANDMCLGVYAEVEEPGRIGRGDAVVLAPG